MRTQSERTAFDKTIVKNLLALLFQSKDEIEEVKLKKSANTNNVDPLDNLSVDVLEDGYMAS